MKACLVTMATIPDRAIAIAAVWSKEAAKTNEGNTADLLMFHGQFPKALEC